MASIAQNLTSSLTGNVPKAILCVRNMKANTANVETLSTNLIKAVSAKSSTGSVLTYQDAAFKTAMTGTGYLALEVQYNPNSISMDTQAGVQVQYGGGNLGNASNNQLVQIDQPTATTMSFQLVFDAMNVEDAFMLENLSPTIGNVQAEVQKLRGKTTYSVQPQLEGLVALLTQNVTRQVLFFWSEMCFQGEVVNVSSHYTMFNKNGAPIRGTVDISIRQDDKSDAKQQYWDKAFTAAFGDELISREVGEVSDMVKYTNNNLLNLNL